ncbi:MAG: DinB family protein [Gemmataceae bacterium]
MKPYLERLLQAMLWADHLVLDATRDCPAAWPLLAHLLAAEHIWLTRLQRLPARHPVWPTLDWEVCQALAAENAAGYTAWLAATDEAALPAPVAYRTTRGDEWSTPALDIFTHVVLHGAYHRGQIATLRAAAGLPDLNTDFITFLRTVS